MPKITRVNDRRWEDATFDPKAKKVVLHEGRDHGTGRTLLSRYLPGQSVAAQFSSAPWDIFVLKGDITVNGELLTAGDHCLCMPNEHISWFSKEGFESLVFVRTNHEWVT